MVKGILADVHMMPEVAALIAAMQREPWTEFWNHLGISLYRFEDIGLTPDATDLEIWQRCQAEELLLITNNRNEDSAGSLESAIEVFNTPRSLPVFTIANLPRFRTSGQYANAVLKQFYDYLLDIDRVRGAGRLYLP